MISCASHVVLFHVLVSDFELLHRNIFTFTKLGGKVTPTSGKGSPRYCASMISFWMDRGVLRKPRVPSWCRHCAWSWRVGSATLLSCRRVRNPDKCIRKCRQNQLSPFLSTTCSLCEDAASLSSWSFFIWGSPARVDGRRNFSLGGWQDSCGWWESIWAVRFHFWFRLFWSEVGVPHRLQPVGS